MKKALRYLNKLIDDGMEYADAVWKTSQRFTDVGYEELQNAYDEQFA